MNFLQLLQRGKSEAELAGPVPVSVNSVIGNTLRLRDAVVDAWRDIQMLPFNWRWMWAQALGNVTVLGGMYYTIDDLLGVAPGTTRFARWKASSNNYAVRAYDPANVQGGEWGLRFYPFDLFESLFLGTTPHAAASPQYWTVAPDRRLVVGPLPDRTYALRANYFKSPQTLALDTDVPEMPEEFHMAIVWKALASRGIAGAEPETVARAMGHYAEIEDRLIADQGEPVTILASPLI